MACYTGNCLTNSDCNGYTCNNHACTTGCVGDLECNTGYVCSQAGNCLTPTIWTPANCGSDGDWWNDTNNWVGATSYGGVDANAVVRISTGPACYPQIVSNASALEVVMSGDTTLRVNSGQTLDIGNTLFLANGNPGASVTNDGTINVAYFTLNSGAVLNNSGIITISTNFINNGANITNTGTINCPAGKQWSLNSSNCVSSACSFNADCETNFGVSYFCSQAGVCSNASSCLVDSECAVNSWCSQNNSCQSSCSIDGDCHVGDLCVNGSCHNPSCTPGNSGNTYCSNNFGSGWCGQNSLCHTSCSESSDCPNVNDSCINNSCYTTTCTPGSDGNNYCNSAFGSVETPYWCSQTGSCTQGSCSTSVDCALGQVCDSGVCYSGDCLINDDCSGQICTNHTCQSCSTTSDCVSGYNSGYFCSQAGLCRNLSSCSIDSDCETSSWCGQDTTCHATCVENNDCHTGWDCNNGVCQEVSGATCGNSIVETGETCDDGNVTAGDGCSAICAVETHYVCSGAPSVCYRCGDGVKQGSEACDDGNIDNADGCSSTCQVESNYTCDSANPSVCHIISTGSSSGGFTTGIVVPTPPPTTQQLNTTFTNEQLIDYSVNIINKIKDLLNQDLGINAQHSNIPPANRSKTIQLLQRLLESLKQLLKLISFKGILNFV
jgi:cysteine-rich repeat protein